MAEQFILNQNHIDNISGLDLNALTWADLRPHYGTGVGYLIKDTGYKKIWGYRNGYGTNVGDIEVSIWTEAAKHLIAREKEESLFNQLLQWETEHNYSRSSKSALYAKSLELHVSRIFDDPVWVNFISFNQRYRPEILDQYPLICVIIECCGKKGLTTNERIARTYEHCIPCPHCGKWSRYEVVEV